jgi:uracil-DNA glycosylase
MDPTKGANRTVDDVSQAASALRWWASAGVDFALDEHPHDRIAESAAAAAAKPAPAVGRAGAGERATPAATRPAGESPARPISQASEVSSNEVAASAQDLPELRRRLEAFEGCTLKRTATQLVFSDGTPGSRVMFVGEAPGADEDRIGRPFVGRAGQLLDRMLAAIGLDRNQVYIANVVPWRPPGNRTPTPQETQACLPFVKRQIELAGPEILVCLGASAAQSLLGIRQGITRVRGAWFSCDIAEGKTLPAMAMLHPAYLLRQPGQKRQAWSDMRALADRLRKGA